MTAGISVPVKVTPHLLSPHSSQRVYYRAKRSYSVVPFEISSCPSLLHPLPTASSRFQPSMYNMIGTDIAHQHRENRHRLCFSSYSPSVATTITAPLRPSLDRDLNANDNAKAGATYQPYTTCRAFSATFSFIIMFLDFVISSTSTAVVGENRDSGDETRIFGTRVVRVLR